MDSSPFRNRLLLVATAVLFSTGGAAIKAAPLAPWQIVCLRSAVAAAFLLLALPESRRGWNWRLALVAAPYATTVILFVLATRLTTAANAIYLQSTAPLYLLLLGPLVLREPIRRSDILYILAVAAGMALFALSSEQAQATAPSPHAGNLCAVASGLTWALTLAGLRWVSRRQKGNPGIAAVAAGNLTAAVVALPMAIPFAGAHWNAAPAVVYLGVVQIGVAYVFLTRAVRHVPAFEATTVLLLEPALNPVWVWMAYGERPGTWSLAGGGVILSATLVNAWFQQKRAPAAAA